MKFTEGHCSGLKNNSVGGYNCKYGHATISACFGNSYPNGEVVPVCIMEDRVLNEVNKSVTIKKWLG